ncbi:MAG: hypothetical protein [Wendovervirus sonii]|uniref:Uncharacterized protein n=1 Tax=phage Lak_Megaphage_Sonny TaxID=3109229 RepID=A0ABZ0Z4G6_9CAUD|nr:MAG: hypothetical protein [phage Lak_Megaphage_Sonny]
MESFKDMLICYSEIICLNEQINKLAKSIQQFINTKLAEMLIGKVIVIDNGVYLTVEKVKTSYSSNITDEFKYNAYLIGTERYISDTAAGELGFCDEMQQSDYEIQVQADIDNEKIILPNDLQFADEATYAKFMEAFNKRCQILDKNGKILSWFDDVEFIHDGLVLRGTLSDFYNADDDTVKVIVTTKRQESIYYIKCSDCERLNF